MVDLNIIKSKIDKCDFDRIKYIYPNIPNDTLGKYVSGFANSEGGYILYGVQDDGDITKVKGFSGDIKEIDEFLKSNFPDIENLFFQTFCYKEKKLLLIEINQCKTMISYNEGLYTMVKNGKNRFVPEEMIKQRVFLSYCHKDKNIMKVVKSSLEKEPYIKLTIDEEQLDYKSDLDEFMKTIKNHDFTVAIISHSYLKSKNCMYEITELMKDDNYINKLLFIILSDDERQFYDEKTMQIKPDIYDSMGRLKYIEYWNNCETELNDSIRALKNPSITPELSNDSNRISLITRSCDYILSKLSKKLGVSFDKMYESDFNDIKKIILNRIYKSNL